MQQHNNNIEHINISDSCDIFGKWLNAVMDNYYVLNIGH